MSETCACGKRKVSAGGCGCGGHGGCGCGGGGRRGSVDQAPQDRSEGGPQLGLRSGI